MDTVGLPRNYCQKMSALRKEEKRRKQTRACDGKSRENGRNVLGGGARQRDRWMEFTP